MNMVDCLANLCTKATFFLSSVHNCDHPFPGIEYAHSLPSFGEYIEEQYKSSIHNLFKGVCTKSFALNSCLKMMHSCNIQLKVCT